MTGHRSKALARVCRWLYRLPIPPEDTEQQILRLFALALAGAPATRLRACGCKLAPFEWFKHTGDPLAALLVHRALAAAGSVHASLAELETGYRSLLTDSPEPAPLLCDLMDLPVAAGQAIALPPASALVAAEREQVIEICRLITMTTSAGRRQIEISGPADLLPALAFSYARDWDLQVSCALVRASAYLGFFGRFDCLWTTQWILDQQNEDGSFGLLQAEVAHCGHDTADWRTYFERTVHAVWALVDGVREPNLQRFVQQAPNRLLALGAAE